MVIWQLRHLLFPKDDLISLSRQLEGYFVQLRGRLANSIEFLIAADHADGTSQVLQAAAIATTERRLAGVNLTDAIDTRSVRWVWWTALTLLAILAVAAGWQPGVALTAAQRILLPFSDVRWPPRNQLSLSNVPAVVPLGQDVELTVANEGSFIPSVVHLEVRNAARGMAAPLRMRRLPDDVYTASLLDLRKTVEVRAVGGDHVDMPWHQIRVVELPRVTAASTVVVYPEYTGIEPARFVTRAEVIVGSRVQVLASTTTKASAARLTDRRPGAEAVKLSIVTRDDANLIVGEWVITSDDCAGHDGQLELDYQGATQRFNSPWKVNVRPDATPGVQATLAVPFAAVTPGGVLPMHVSAEDDIELRTVGLVANDDAGTVARAYGLVRTRPGIKPINGLGDAWDGTIQLDLGQLTSLAAGQQLTVKAAATDFQPAEMASEAFVVDVISRQAMAARLTMLQSEIFNELEAQAVAQQDLASRTQLLGEQTSRDLAAVREVRNQQGELVRQIATGDDSAVSRLSRLLDAHRANRLNEQRLVAAGSLATTSLTALGRYRTPRRRTSTGSGPPRRVVHG